MTWTDESAISTAVWTQLEPWGGFGQNPFGSPDDEEFSIHDRGFGDPITVWTDING